MRATFYPRKHITHFINHALIPLQILNMKLRYTCIQNKVHKKRKNKQTKNERMNHRDDESIFHSL